jgi:hypothetical protein
MEYLSFGLSYSIHNTAPMFPRALIEACFVWTAQPVPEGLSRVASFLANNSMDSSQRGNVRGKYQGAGIQRKYHFEVSSATSSQPLLNIVRSSMFAHVAHAFKPSKHAANITSSTLASIIIIINH